MRYWLLKTEPESYSIDDLKRDKATSWEGVRNYQARNHIRAMEVGDGVIIYHSSCVPPGAVGVGKVVSAPRPDPTELNQDSGYYEPRATNDKNIWSTIDIAFEKKFKHPVPLIEIKANKKLSGIEIVRTGSRLSVSPVSLAHFELLVEMGS